MVVASRDVSQPMLLAVIELLVILGLGIEDHYD
jgi:hypothetical protein